MMLAFGGTRSPPYQTDISPQNPMPAEKARILHFNGKCRRDEAYRDIMSHPIATHTLKSVETGVLFMGQYEHRDGGRGR